MYDEKCLERKKREKQRRERKATVFMNAWVVMVWDDDELVPLPFIVSFCVCGRENSEK